MTTNVCFKAELQKMDNPTLLGQVKLLVGKEKAIISEVIESLREIETRKLHLEGGYPSMFAFATDFLGYSEAEAHIRIQAARLSQSIPELPAMIQAGTLSLSVAAAAQSTFRKENIRRKEKCQASLSAQEKRQLIEDVSGLSRRKAEDIISSKFCQPKQKTIQIEASEALLEKINQLMDFMAHQNFERSHSRMFEILVDQELARWSKKLGECANQRANSETEKTSREITSNEDRRIEQSPAQDRSIEQSSSVGSVFEQSSKRSRYISNATRRLVWAKCKGKCSYQNPETGHQCRSTHGLQLDHKTAFSKGGSSKEENLTLLCSAHNLWKGVRSLKV